jgi:carboxylesterase type B
VCVQEYSLLCGEDCLFLDVHAPDNLTAPAPVVFYIHGGSLVLGAGQWEYVDVLAVRLDAIVVTVQYRLGVLGWLCVEGLDSCNFGLLDQQAALRWTQENIAAFGGDPSLVTVAGQSSGGTSIFANLASPAARGLFSGAITMSGSPNISLTREARAERRHPQRHRLCAPWVSALRADRLHARASSRKGAGEDEQSSARLGGVKLRH